MGSEELVYEYLTRLFRLLQAEERSASELVPVQLQALLYLSRCNRYSDKPSTVAEYLGITKGTASQTLGALERGGYVSKRVDRQDRRAVRLRLSGKGRRLASKLLVPVALRNGVSDLGKDEQERLVSQLERLLVGIQRSSGQKSFGVCHSCRHFTESSPKQFVCGLTDEPLSVTESFQICREHEALEALEV